MGTGSPPRGGRFDAAGAAAAAFALYAITACRTIFTGASAQFAGASASFGVPGPPGYPLYTLLNGLWVHLFPPAHRALAANLGSGLSGAAAVGLTLLLARRLGRSHAAAWLAAMTLALGRVFWARSAAAGVESFDLLLLLAVAHTTWAASRQPGRASRVAAGAAAGLWIGHRWTNLLYLPAILLLARAATEQRYDLVRRAPPGRRERLLTAGSAALAWALPLLYLPLASAARPIFDIGDPRTAGRFFTMLKAAPAIGDVDAESLAHAFARMGAFFAALPLESGAAALLAVAAAWLAARGPRRRERTSAAFLLLLAVNVAATSIGELGDARAYQIPAILAVAMLGARGADALLESAGSRRRTQVAALLIAAAAALIPLNWRADNLAPNRATRLRAADLLDSVPPNALLMVKSESDTHALWYLQGIEGRSPGVLVVSLAYDDDWYFEGLRAHAPRDPIPISSSRQPAAGRYLAIAEALSPTRPVSFAFDPLELAQLAPSPWWEEHTFAPVGLVVGAFPRRDTEDQDALVATDLAFWRARYSRPSAIESGSDFGSRMIGLEYVFALQRTGEFLAGLDRRPEAEEIFRTVIRLRPSRWERDLLRAHGEAARRFGAPDLEGRAMAALADLSRPAADTTGEHWFRGTMDSTGASLPPFPPVGYPPGGGTR